MVAPIASLLGLIAIGAVLVRLHFLRGAWPPLNRLCYFVLVPTLIFSAAAGRSLPWADAVTVGGGSIILVAFAAALSLPAARLGTSARVDAAGLGQMAYRFNSALGLAATAPLGDAAVQAMAVAIGCSVPVVNAFAVAQLGGGRAARPAAVIADVARNPFFLASAAGTAIALGTDGLPASVADPLRPIAAAAIPLALITLGATLDLSALLRIDRHVMVLHTIKLVLMPCAAVVVGIVFGLEAPDAAALIVYAGLPASAAAHLLAARYGAAAAPVARAITQSTVLAILTLPLWFAVATALVSE